jgi:hypothetical protein
MYLLISVGIKNEKKNEFSDIRLNALIIYLYLLNDTNKNYPLKQQIQKNSSYKFKIIYFFLNIYINHITFI